MHPFKTATYHGVWFDYQGERDQLRARIRDYLRTETGDPEGRLEVRADGPHWIGRTTLHLSYSHTTGAAVLVYSRERALGVDAEKLDRRFAQPPQEIARRYFHAEEVPQIRSSEDFLRLWCRKEADAKLTRQGLKDNLSALLAPQSAARAITPLPVTPEGYCAYVAIGT